MKKTSLLLSAFALYAVQMFAQSAEQIPCGVSFEAGTQLRERLAKNIEALESGNVVSERNGIKYVPIHFHLVADSDGNGRLRETKAFEQLCRMNIEFAPVGIQFYLSPHPVYGLFDKSINNDNVYSDQTNSWVMNLRRHPNAINVYCVGNPVSGNDQPPGAVTLAYYNIPQDWIVCLNSRINDVPTNGTLSHETGHFFSLLHPFYGWEDPFESGDPGWPIAPAMSPNGIPTERMNGTNCTTAGDMICDTPPDYNLGLFSGPGCAQYNGGAKDPQGVLVDPMETNFMSYWPDCDNYAFTQTQINLMNQDLDSSPRNYLDNNFVPEATEVVSPSNMLIGPINNVVTQFYDEVLLEWNDVAGATHYWVEIDVIPSQNSPQRQFFLETGTSKFLTNLQANKTYYWRVTPFNYYATCADAKQGSFKTALTSGTNEIKSISGWQVQPNPANNGDQVKLRLSATENFDGDIYLFDAAGRRVFARQQVSFQAGESSLALELPRLSNGVYFVTIESASGRSVRKLVISE